MVCGTEFYGPILRELELDGDPDVSMVVTGGGLAFDFAKQQPHSGTTLLMMATINCDLPCMRAVLRNGADLEFRCIGGTVLYHAIRGYTMLGEVSARHGGGRSRLKVIQFLLEVGAVSVGQYRER